MAANIQETFTAFFDGWLVRHHLLQQQLTASISQQDDDIDNYNEDECRDLLQQTLNHYKDYYEHKSQAVEVDVFLFFSPPWYSSFEKTLFWITGFPPLLLFRFMDGLGLTEEQAERMETVRAEMVWKKKEVGDALARVQESLSGPPLYGLVSRGERLVDGEVSELDKAMEEMKTAMRVVVGEADALRGTVATEVMEVLEVVQRVKLFAAVGEFLIRARRVGLEIDAAQNVS